MRPLLLRLCVLLACSALACAHGLRGANAETLKSAAEEMHQRERWRDWRGISEVLVVDRRKAFIDAVKRDNDDRDLTITDYELLSAKLLQDRGRGTVNSRVSWVRLPSMTEQSEEVVSRFVFLDGAWLLDSQEGGPFGQILAP